MLDDLVEYIHKLICTDLKEDLAEPLDYNKELYSLFFDIYKKTNIPFVIIIGIYRYQSIKYILRI